MLEAPDAFSITAPCGATAAPSTTIAFDTPDQSRPPLQARETAERGLHARAAARDP